MNSCQTNEVQSHRTARSSVIPIEITSKTLGRMASLRRSLIPVDFFSKRKKKDKRRNTIAECETKNLDESNQPMQYISFTQWMNGSHGFPERVTNVSDTRCENVNKITNHVPLPNIESEENNNTHQNSKTTSQTVDDDADTPCNINMDKPAEGDSKTAQTLESCTTDSNSSHSSNKENSTKKKIGTGKRPKKSKSYLPISTSSAAMTVAVRMRQTFVKDTETDDGHSSSGNWSGTSSGHDSSDTEDTKSQIIAPGQTSNDSLLSKNGKDRPTENEIQTAEELQNPQHGLSTCNGPIQVETLAPCQIGDSTNTAETQCNGKVKNLDYSFESDEDLDAENLHRYLCHGLSLSSESLNSLLSRAGNELSTSTDTLLSDYNKNPPIIPPPPPMQLYMVPATTSNNDKTVQTERYTPLKATLISPTKKNFSKKLSEMRRSNENKKATQNTMTEAPYDITKLLCDDSKSSKIGSILQKKFKFKENSPSKSKYPDKRKINRVGNHRPINMYGEEAVISRTVTTVIHDSKKISLEKPKVMNTFRPNVDPTEGRVKNGFGHTAAQWNVIVNNQCSTPSIRSQEIDQMSLEHSTMQYNTCNEAKDIPMKYSHQITVTPQKQSTNTHFNTNPNYCSSLDHERNIQCASCYCYPETSKTRVSTPMYSPSNGNCSPHTYSPWYYQDEYCTTNYNPCHQPKDQSTAHVVLNAEGNVIYSTSSLDRKLHGKAIHQYPCVQPERMYNTLDLRQSKQNYVSNPGHWQKDSHLYSFNRNQVQNNTIQETKLYADNSVHTCFHNADPFLSHPGNSNKQANRSDNMKCQSCNKHSLDCNYIRYEQPDFSDIYNRNDDSVYCYVPTNSFLASTDNQAMLPHENLQNERPTNYSTLPHSTFSTNQSTFHPKIPKPSPNLTVLSPKSSSMTTDDLFAIIHDSKKRLNIKTESDLTVNPSSSGSFSPVPPTMTIKSGPAETGFLGAKNTFGQPNKCRDRRSWADFRASSDRGSLASDRMGPNKPTSLHDFKMLLLQTRSSQDTTRQQKSAVEQLKLAPSNSAQMTKSLPASPMSPYGFYDGHMTVPLKRNTRAKGGTQPRCIMYPPILEDYSEDMENTFETFKSDIKKKSLILESGNNNEYLCHVIANNGTNSNQQCSNNSMWV